MPPPPKRTRGVARRHVVCRRPAVRIPGAGRPVTGRTNSRRSAGLNHANESVANDYLSSINDNGNDDMCDCNLRPMWSTFTAVASSLRCCQIRPNEMLPMCVGAGMSLARASYRRRLNWKQSRIPGARIEIIVVLAIEVDRVGEIVTCDLLSGGSTRLQVGLDLHDKLRIHHVYQAMVVENTQWDAVDECSHKIVDILQCLGPRALWISLSTASPDSINDNDEIDYITELCMTRQNQTTHPMHQLRCTNDDIDCVGDP